MFGNAGVRRCKRHHLHKHCRGSSKHRPEGDDMSQPQFVLIGSLAIADFSLLWKTRETSCFGFNLPRHLMYMRFSLYLQRTISFSAPSPAPCETDDPLLSVYSDSDWMCDAVSIVLMQERLRGLFSGLGPTVLRDAPFSGLYLLLYVPFPLNVVVVIPSAIPTNWEKFLFLLC